MITRREIALKWAVTSFCALFLLFVHALLTAHLSVRGVAPFLPPIIVAAVCSIESDLPSTIFSIVFGVLCDLALGGLFPCLYTLGFALSAVLILVLSHSVLQPGFFCALAASFAAFFVVDALCAAALLIAGDATLGACALLFLREFSISLLLLIPCYAVFSALHKFFTV